MTVSIDYATKVITVEKTDMSLIQSSPEIRGLDVEALRISLMALHASEAGMPHLISYSHNTEVLLGGATYARIIEFVNGYTIEFEDAPYAVKLSGANTNVEDVMVVNNVSLRTANSAGLQTVAIGSGVTQQDKDDIENQIFSRVVEGTESFEVIMRLMRAALAGDIVVETDGSYTIKSIDGLTDRIEGNSAANNGRDVTAVDGS